jgi:hypothetical protein
MLKDKWQNKLVEKLAVKYGLDKRVVKVVTDYPLLFTKRVMNDPADDTPIRIKHLGVFAYRGSRTKEKVERPKFDMILQNVEELYDVHYKDLFESQDEFVEYLVDSFKEAEYSAIRSVHEIFKEKIKYAKKAETKTA